MTAYYSEFDPFAAAWLRNLIAAGHIAPGDVDERDLWDVSPDDLRPYTQVHLCAGIGVWSYALRRAGWRDDEPVWTASFPCQPFSQAGKGAGFADERHLWPAGFHLIRECDPAILLGEQVASKDGLAWLDLVRADLEATGRTFAAADLCAAGVGAPHIRQRSFWMAYRERVGRQRILGNCSAKLDSRNDDERTQSGFGPSEQANGLADTTRQRDDRSGQRGPGRRLEYPDGSATDGLAAAAGRRADYGAAGPFRSYAATFGVCWHPDCRDSERNYCDCDTRGAPAGWRWDDDGGWLADTDDAGSQGRAGVPERADQRAARQGGMAVGLADDERSGRREERSDTGGIAIGDSTQGRAAGSGYGSGDRRPGPVNGFWSAADWLACRDGKWRPVEPGTFPLAHGAASRVGRLRGYGNAIVAPVAEEFIGAAVEALEIAALLK